MRLYETSGLGRLARSCLKGAEILFTGIRVFPYKHALTTRLKVISKYCQIWSKQCQNCSVECESYKIVMASGMKFSHIITSQIHLAYRAVLLSRSAQLPYKQSLRMRVSNNMVGEKSDWLYKIF